MRKELHACLQQMSGIGKSLENVFDKMYIIAAFPSHAVREDFCRWAYIYEPEVSEIVEYFVPEKK